MSRNKSLRIKELWLILKAIGRIRVEVRTIISVTSLADGKDWAPQMSDMDRRIKAMEKKGKAQDSGKS